MYNKPKLHSLITIGVVGSLVMICSGMLMGDVFTCSIGLLVGITLLLLLPFSKKEEMK